MTHLLDCLPPGLAVEDGAPAAPGLGLRLLWWIGRARWIEAEPLAALAGVESGLAAPHLARLGQAGLVVRQRLSAIGTTGLLLTNGGVARLAASVGLTPQVVATALGWDCSGRELARQGEAAIADAWYTPGHQPGWHRLAVYRLLGQLAAESRAEEVTFWGLRLWCLWTEAEVARLAGWEAPRPDACFILRLRRRFWLPYLLELELGSRRPRATAEKLVAYAGYATTWACERTWETLPGLLFLTRDAHYERELAARLAEVQTRLPVRVEVLLTHQGWLEGAGLLGAIWRAPGPEAVLPEERATCWGKEDNRLLLAQQEAAQQARARREGKL